LSVSPLADSLIAFITPLGNLNPPGHTLPTDHIYFYFVDPDHCPCDLATPREVRAPAAGTVAYILRVTDDKVGIRIDDRVMYYPGHLRVAAGMRC
jgi:hypothetical protein